MAIIDLIAVGICEDRVIDDHLSTMAKNADNEELHFTARQLVHIILTTDDVNMVARALKALRLLLPLDPGLQSALDQKLSVLLGKGLALQNPQLAEAIAIFVYYGARKNPEIAQPYISALISFLGLKITTTGAYSYYALMIVANEMPIFFSPHTGALIRVLGGSSMTAKTFAMRIIAALAVSHPEYVTEARYALKSLMDNAPLEVIKKEAARAYQAIKNVPKVPVGMECRLISDPSGSHADDTRLWQRALGDHLSAAYVNELPSIDRSKYQQPVVRKATRRTNDGRWYREFLEEMKPEESGRSPVESSLLPSPQAISPPAQRDVLSPKPVVLPVLPVEVRGKPAKPEEAKAESLKLFNIKVEPLRPAESGKESQQPLKTVAASETPVKAMPNNKKENEVERLVDDLRPSDDIEDFIARFNNAVQAEQVKASIESPKPVKVKTGLRMPVESKTESEQPVKAIPKNNKEKVIRNAAENLPPADDYEELVARITAGVTAMPASAKAEPQKSAGVKAEPHSLPEIKTGLQSPVRVMPRNNTENVIRNEADELPPADDFEALIAKITRAETSEPVETGVGPLKPVASRAEPAPPAAALPENKPAAGIDIVAEDLKPLDDIDELIAEITDAVPAEDGAPESEDTKKLREMMSLVQSDFSMSAGNILDALGMGHLKRGSDGKLEDASHKISAKEFISAMEKLIAEHKS